MAEKYSYEKKNYSLLDSAWLWVKKVARKKKYAYLSQSNKRMNDFEDDEEDTIGDIKAPKISKFLQCRYEMVEKILSQFPVAALHPTTLPGPSNPTLIISNRNKSSEGSLVTISIDVGVRCLGVEIDCQRHCYDATELLLWEDVNLAPLMRPTINYLHQIYKTRPLQGGTRWDEVHTLDEAIQRDLDFVNNLRRIGYELARKDEAENIRRKSMKGAVFPKLANFTKRVERAFLAHYFNLDLNRQYMDNGTMNRNDWAEIEKRKIDDVIDMIDPVLEVHAKYWRETFGVVDLILIEEQGLIFGMDGKMHQIAIKKCLERVFPPDVTRIEVISARHKLNVYGLLNGEVAHLRQAGHWKTEKFVACGRTGRLVYAPEKLSKEIRERFLSRFEVEEEPEAIEKKKKEEEAFQTKQATAIQQRNNFVDLFRPKIRSKKPVPIQHRNDDDNGDDIITSVDYYNNDDDDDIVPAQFSSFIDQEDQDKFSRVENDEDDDDDDDRITFYDDDDLTFIPDTMSEGDALKKIVNYDRRYLSDAAISEPAPQLYTCQFEDNTIDEEEIVLPCLTKKRKYDEVANNTSSTESESKRTKFGELIEEDAVEATRIQYDSDPETDQLLRDILSSNDTKSIHTVSSTPTIVATPKQLRKVQTSYDDDDDDDILQQMDFFAKRETGDARLSTKKNPNPTRPIVFHESNNFASSTRPLCPTAKLIPSVVRHNPLVQRKTFDIFTKNKRQ